MSVFIGSQDVVVVSRESVGDSDPRSIIASNVDFVNALFEEYLRPEEISQDALLGYYVDYYLAQVTNGGFSQFVYNTGWQPVVVEAVKSGLTAIEASRHLELFERGERVAEREPSKLSKFLASAFFGKNDERDRFDSITMRFFEIQKIEDLDLLNAAWLKSRPGLCVVPKSEMRQQISIRASRVGDRDVRIAEARSREPHYAKCIRTLCDAAGHTLETITGGDPTNEYKGQNVLAWYFITDKGHHYMVEVGGKAIMFDGKTRQVVAEIALA